MRIYKLVCVKIFSFSPSLSYRKENFLRLFVNRRLGQKSLLFRLQNTLNLGKSTSIKEICVIYLKFSPKMYLLK